MHRPAFSHRARPLPRSFLEFCASESTKRLRRLGTHTPNLRAYAQESRGLRNNTYPGAHPAGERNTGRRTQRDFCSGRAEGGDGDRSNAAARPYPTRGKDSTRSARCESSLQSSLVIALRGLIILSFRYYHYNSWCTHHWATFQPSAIISNLSNYFLITRPHLTIPDSKHHIITIRIIHHLVVTSRPYLLRIGLITLADGTPPQYQGRV